MAAHAPSTAGMGQYMILRGEIAKWTKVVREANLRVE